MRKRYIIYFIIVFIINIFSCLFSLIFCATYKYASFKWFQGFLTGFIIDYFGIKLIVPAIKSLLRQFIIYTQSNILINTNT